MIYNMAIAGRQNPADHLASVEERLAKVEKDVAELKAKSQMETQRLGWTKKLEGSFECDSEYEEILRLGREEQQADVIDDERLLSLEMQSTLNA